MQTKRCACLNCGHILSAASSLVDKANPPPNEGDFTVCLYCSHLMVFKADLSVRNPNSTEIIEAAGDKNILEVMAFARTVRERAKDEQKKNT